MSLGRTIKNWVTDHGQESAVTMVREGLASGKIPLSALTLKGLAVDLMGDNWEQKLDAYRHGAYRGQESADAVDASTFASITGNQLIDVVRAKYNSPEYIADQLVTNIPVTNGNLDTQKEPYLSDVLSASGDIKDVVEDIVEPGQAYRRSEFLPNYVLLGKPHKRGRICEVTMEMIYADRTRQAFDSAGSVGDYLRRTKEYRIFKTLLGTTDGGNYTFSMGGATEATSSPYVTTDTTDTYEGVGPTGKRWVNAIENNGLTDWTNLNVIEQLFNQMRDPVTGAPIDVAADTLLCMPFLKYTAQHILHSTQTRFGDGASASVATYVANDLKQYNLMTSRHLYFVGQSATFKSQDYHASTSGGTTLTLTDAELKQLYFVGNFKKALYYREVYPLRTMQAPPMNPEEFNRDIVLMVKASEFGVPGWLDPRYVVRSIAKSSWESQSD